MRLPSSDLSVRFFLRKDKAEENFAPVFARVTIDHKSTDISLKRVIAIERWDVSTGKSRGENVDERAFNSFLDQVRASLSKCFADLKAQQHTITAKAVKNLFCGVTSTDQSLLHLVEYHNKHLKSTMAWGTLKNYFTTQRYITEFLQTSYKVSDFPLYKLNYRFLTDFEVFLREYQQPDHQRPCGHNTVLKHIERLRKMVNLAIKNDWLSRDPFSKFQARFIRKNRGFLSQEEVHRMEQITLEERLSLARDLFVFSCYTGLCYIDVMSLTKENLSRGIEGDYWLTLARRKTRQHVYLPLLPKAVEILLKYKHDPRSVGGRLLPPLSNQKLNAYIKEVGKFCDIQKNLTFHIARHTFATTITLSNDVPIETVSKVLGHASIRTTQIYAKVVQKKVSQDMIVLREKLTEHAPTKPSND